MLAKLPTVESRLKEVQEGLLLPLLDKKRSPIITQDELPGITKAIQDRNIQATLEPDSYKLLVKTFLLVDGSTESFTGLRTMVLDHLASLKISSETLEENFAPELIRFLCDEEDISGEANQPIKYQEIKDIDLFKNDPDMIEFVSTSTLRKRVAAVVDILAKFIKQAKKDKPTEKLVQKLRDYDRKILAAEEKLKTLQDKAKAKEEASKKVANTMAEKQMKVELKEKAKKEAEEKKKKEAEEKEEKRREEERRKEEERKKKEEEKKKKEEEKEEERRKKEEERRKKEEEKEEERKKKEEEKKKEEALKEKAKVQLTKFFTSVPKQQENCQNELISEEKFTIWKKGLGSIRRDNDWNEERRDDFDALVHKLGAQMSNKMSDERQMNLEVELQVSCAKLLESLKSHLSSLRDESASIRQNEMDDELDGRKKPVPRRIFIKYEDYLNDCYEYRGLFKRRSNFVTARRPFSKDEDLIDYELSSDEEFQLEEADSIHTKAADDEEEESVNEEEEDNFVVPDGYLSEEEFGSLDEEDKRNLELL